MTDTSDQFVVFVFVRCDRWDAVCEDFGGPIRLKHAVEETAGTRPFAILFYDRQSSVVSGGPPIERTSPNFRVAFQFRYDTFIDAATARRRLAARYDGWTVQMREVMNTLSGPIWAATEVK